MAKATLLAGVDLSELSHGQILELLCAAQKLAYPEAKISRGKLVCTCGKKETPRLIETGMVVTHHIETISRKKIEGRGWDGSSSDVSEEGDAVMLECPECFGWYRIPEKTELDWL